MQHPTITLILRYPNSTLQLASQEHLKNKLIIECPDCHAKEVVDRKQGKYTCSHCKNSHSVKGPSGMNCRQKDCNGSMKIYVSNLGILSYQCDSCGLVQPVQNVRHGIF